LGQSESEIFLQMGLDRQLTDLPVGQITLNGFNKSRHLAHKSSRIPLKNTKSDQGATS